MRCFYVYLPGLDTREVFFLSANSYSQFDFVNDLRYPNIIIVLVKSTANRKKAFVKKDLFFIKLAQ